MENLKNRFYNWTWDASDTISANLCRKPIFRTFGAGKNQRFERLKPTKPTLRFFKTDENRPFSCLTPTKTEAFYVGETDKNRSKRQKSVRALIGFGDVKPTKTDDILCLNSTKFSTRVEQTSGKKLRNCSDQGFLSALFEPTLNFDRTIFWLGLTSV